MIVVDSTADIRFCTFAKCLNHLVDETTPETDLPKLHPDHELDEHINSFKQTHLDFVHKYKHESQASAVDDLLNQKVGHTNELLKHYSGLIQSY
jgi:hypothetical protein